MSVLVIIPCYNEEGNIAAVVESINEYGYDYIVINDGSRDGSLRVLQDGGYLHVDLKNNVGIGAAVQTGYQYACDNGYDIAVQFDGDGQHDAAYIGRLIEPIETGQADLVIGSRFLEEKSAFQSTVMRRVGIKVLSFLLEKMTGKAIKDVTSGFRAANRDVIERFAVKYPLEYPEPVTNFSLSKFGYRICEVPAEMKAREHGVSSIGRLKSVYYMLNVIILFFVIRFSKEGGGY